MEQNYNHDKEPKRRVRIVVPNAELLQGFGGVDKKDYKYVVSVDR